MTPKPNPVGQLVLGIIVCTIIAAVIVVVGLGLFGWLS